MQFEVPMLSVAELLHSMKETNIDFSERDLTNPDPRHWHYIYGAMFETLTEKSIDQSIQSMLMVVKLHTEHYDIFEEGFSQLAFTTCMSRVMIAGFFRDFTLMDVIQLTPGRAKRLSSSFINMLRHCQNIRVAFYEMIEDIKKSRDQIEFDLKRNRDLKESLAKGIEVEEPKKALKQELQNEFEAERQCICELKKQSESEKKTGNVLKLNVAEIEKEKERLKQALTEIQQECDKMSHKIVQSPKRFRHEQERYKAKVTDLKNELITKERALSENKKLLEQTSERLQAITKAVKLGRDVLSDLEKSNELDVMIQQQSDIYLENKDKYNSTVAREEDIKDKLCIRKEQRHKSLSQIDLNRESTHHELTNLKQQRCKLEESLKATKLQCSQLLSQQAVILTEIEELEALFKARTEEYENKCVEIFEEINSINENVIQETTKVKSGLMDEDVG
ncbi:unnamed protein product [Lymnaea stagnalis]|uniref:Kinetochore protein Nuf2 N-terminal domain-containing protein n=1 Tax=Lymnaea stagnalis TaxID=6523 RepID=A0AAV2HXH2_LYMST